ncbi:MAG: alpha/beta hydrolase [Anaerolineae bacterium]|nr:alpha/beta hydrolase [Anaerolineae bacterium]
MRKLLVLTLATLATILSTSVIAKAQTDATAEAPTTAAPSKTGYAAVNGLEMYYEIYGTGDPIVLLHGGLGGIVEFQQVIPLLSQTRQVIAVELQAHGHTADIDRPLKFEFMADDVAALIKSLGFEKADVLGYSLGGGVALQTAIRHPEVIRKLVLVSTAFKSAGVRPEFAAGMSGMNADAASQMLQTPMYGYYSSVAPKLDDWSKLVGKSGALLSETYDWSKDVANIKIPTLVIAGDSDYVTTGHAVELFKLLGGDVAGDFVGLPSAQLAMLPATSHFTILTRTDLLLPIITPFLDAAPKAAQ